MLISPPSYRTRKGRGDPHQARGNQECIPLMLEATLLDFSSFPGLFWRWPCSGCRFISVISGVIYSVGFWLGRILLGFSTFTPTPTPGVSDEGLMGCLRTGKRAFTLENHFGMGVPCWSAPPHKPQGSQMIKHPLGPPSASLLKVESFNPAKDYTAKRFFC